LTFLLGPSWIKFDDVVYLPHLGRWVRARSATKGDDLDASWLLIGSFFLVANDSCFCGAFGACRVSAGDNGGANTKVPCFSLVSICALAALIVLYPESSKSLLSRLGTVKFPAFQVAPSLCYSAQGAGTFTTVRLHGIN